MPKRPAIKVPFQGGELEGTRDDFRQLINDIKEALIREAELYEMNPPVVDRGTLSYDSVKSFFCQVYPSSRATQLHNQLVSAAKEDRFGLTVRCSVCKHAPSVSFCSDNKPHGGRASRFLIDVASLKKFAQSVDEGRNRPRGFGKTLTSDLKVLVEKL